MFLAYGLQAVPQQTTQGILAEQNSDNFGDFLAHLSTQSSYRCQCFGERMDLFLEKLPAKDSPLSSRQEAKRLSE